MINDDILAHARQCAPAESCGYVVRTAQGERYFPCENLSAEPTMYFRISPEDYLNARNRGDIVALVHSHPDGKPCLSSADRTLQIQSGLDWWLVCDNRIHKFRCVPHLTGRQFEHGVTDCYTLFRDAYHLAGIDMPDFDREDDWWSQGKSLYLDHLEAAGFYRVNPEDAQPGDVLICCFGSPTPNHAAIYCGNGELLHHIGASFIPGLNAVAAAVLFSAGTSMALGGVAQMLTPVPKTPTVGQTDNGKQNTYFSSLENMVAQGNPVPVLYGEMKIGSRVISQMMSTRDESTSGKVVVIGSPLQADTTSRQDGGITRPSVVLRQ